MVKLGNYEITDELYLTAHGSVSKARHVDEDETGLFAAKRFAVERDDASEPRWELQSFLDRVRVQHSLTSRGAAHWLPIHDLGQYDDTAWYVTDYHPLSLQKLIGSRNVPEADALYEIVSGILAGLAELKTLRGRSHGNLKTTNVLIAGRDLKAAAVRLTDPASNAVASRLGEAGDVLALGQLIRALIAGGSKPAQWPLTPSPEWAALGRRGERWRKLCNDLLNPDPALRPSLAAVAPRLRSLQRRKPFPLRRIASVAAGIALAGAVALGGLSVLDHAARAPYCQAKRDWFGTFVDAAADPVRQSRWRTDPDLTRVLAEIPFAALADVDCDEHRLVRWDYADYLAVRDANTVVSTVQREFPYQWTRAARAWNCEIVSVTEDGNSPARIFRN